MSSVHITVLLSWWSVFHKRAGRKISMALEVQRGKHSSKRSNHLPWLAH
jgi:hypothetical protein